MLTTLTAKVDPSHSAVLVVDMQNDFCARGGLFDRQGLSLTMIQDMAPRLAGFIGKARMAGVPVIFVQSIYNSKDNWYLSDIWLEHVGTDGNYVDYPVCEQGSWGADFYGNLRPLPGELIINKHRYSAFIGTDLDLTLKSRGIRTLIMAGVGTSVCVESTAREGFMRDYYIVMLGDCTASPLEESHKHALKQTGLFFGTVTGSEEVVKCWSQVAPEEG